VFVNNLYLNNLIFLWCTIFWLYNILVGVQSNHMIKLITVLFRFTLNLFTTWTCFVCLLV